MLRMSDGQGLKLEKKALFFAKFFAKYMFEKAVKGALRPMHWKQSYD